MKRMITLLLAAGLALGATTTADAAEIKAKGLWHNTLSFADRNFEEHNGEDSLQAVTRLRTQIDFIASQNLKGVLYLEVGPHEWGKTSTGGSLGTDGVIVKVRYNYVDWVIPETSVKVRMGLQNFTLPGFAIEHPVLGGGSADGAGITIAGQFSENIGATLFWLRAENDNASGKYGDMYGYSDAMDFAGVTVPMVFDGVKVTPWAMYGAIGRDSFDKAGSAGDQKKLLAGLLPLGASNTNMTGNSVIDRHGEAWWIGVASDLASFDPFHFAFDALYGSVDFDGGYTDKDGKRFEIKRAGWLASFLGEYKLDSMTPGFIVWYASGDDGNIHDGSERLPSINPDVKLTSYGFDGTNFGRAAQTLGMSLGGTTGAIAQICDLTFMEDLQHTLKLAYYKGTNNTENVRKNMISNPSSTVQSMFYLTTADSAWEVNVDSQYDIYKDLALFLELGYIRFDLNKDVWRTFDVKENNFKATVCLRYTF